MRQNCTAIAISHLQNQPRKSRIKFNDLTPEEKTIFWESLKSLSKITSEVPENQNPIAQG